MDYSSHSLVSPRVSPNDEYHPEVDTFREGYEERESGGGQEINAGKKKKSHIRGSRPPKSGATTTLPLTISPDNASSDSSENGIEHSPKDEADDQSSDDILYSVRCFEPNKLNKVFYSRKQFKGLELSLQSDTNSAIEIITEISGMDSSGQLIGQKKSTWATERAGPTLALGKNFIVSEIRRTMIVIHSRLLQEALRDIITYYPDQNLTGKSIHISSPYSVLVHHFNELKRYRSGLLPAGVKNDALCTATAKVEEWEAGEKKPSTAITAQLDLSVTPMQRLSTSDRTAAHDIDVLLGFLEPEYLQNVYPEENLHQRGVASFEGLWLLLKPGTDVYAEVDGELSAFVILSVDRRKDSIIETWVRSGVGVDRRSKVEDRWVVTLWNFGYAGGKLARQVHHFTISTFPGEREIISLPVFPCTYHDKLFNNKLRSYLQERGRKYWGCIRRVPAHMKYDGSTLDWKPKQYSGEIVIDPRGYLRYSTPSRAPNSEPSPALSPAPRQNNEQMEENDHHAYDSYADNWDRSAASKAPPDYGGGARWKSYNNIDPRDEEQKELTEHQYFLFPQHLLGFALKEKAWMIFNINHVEEIDWPRDEDAAMKYLVLPPHDKETVKALSRKFMKADEIIWSADYIEEKGAGQVFLLHGPPGTGKTFTVECVARYAQRPLLGLTVADIGIKEDSMESMLDKWFQLAANWRAVLLLDEADVFLEQRQVTDLRRNSLVSVFLRTMEYYTGMLFLTTNRMGQIDDAFLSRIQVALGYKRLGSDARNSIWTGFFDKIEHERPDIIISERAKTYIREDKEFSADDENWNGREIRNALHTAIALASHDTHSKNRTDSGKEIRVEIKHFEKVSLRRAEFTKYRNRIGNNLDEEGRAIAAKNRARAE